MRTLFREEIESYKEKGKPDESKNFIDYYLDQIAKVSISVLLLGSTTNN